MDKPHRATVRLLDLIVNRDTTELFETLAAVTHAIAYQTGRAPTDVAIDLGKAVLCEEWAETRDNLRKLERAFVGVEGGLRIV